MQYKLIRSRRKTISIQVGQDGILVVRAPLYSGIPQIEGFILEKMPWIEKQKRLQQEKTLKLSSVKPMTPEQFSRLKKIAKGLASQRIAYYAPMLGVSDRLGKVTVRCQKTKWGSCTSEGNISINCLLALAPQQVFDSVIVHELCHLLEMNHSKRFYYHVLRVFPEYQKWNRWLKENGAMLHAMVPRSQR